MADLEGVRDLGDGPHRRLSGQTEASSKIGVGQLVQVVLPEYLAVEANAREPRTRFIAARKRRSQACSLLTRRQHSESGDQLHTVKYGLKSLLCQVRRAGDRPAIPPPPEGGGFSRETK